MMISCDLLSCLLGSWCFLNTREFSSPVSHQSGHQALVTFLHVPGCFLNIQIDQKSWNPDPVASVLHHLTWWFPCLVQKASFLLKVDNCTSLSATNPQSLSLKLQQPFFFPLVFLSKSDPYKLARSFSPAADALIWTVQWGGPGRIVWHRVSPQPSWHVLDCGLSWPDSCFPPPSWLLCLSLDYWLFLVSLGVIS